MPENEGVEEVVEGERPEVDPRPAPSVSPEEVSQLRETITGLNEQLAEMRGALTAMQSVRREPAAAPIQESLISDEEIEAAIEEGKGAASKVRALVNQTAEQVTRKIKLEEIDPLRNSSISTLRDLSARSIESLPHYKDYKKEIEQMANQMAPETLVSPETWRLLYNNVIGTHQEEITQRAVEEAMRKARDDTGSPNLPGNSSGRAQEPKTPRRSARDIGGDAAAEALRAKGVDEDELVRRMNIPGVTTWEEYLEMGRRLENDNG